MNVYSQVESIFVHHRLLGSLFQYFQFNFAAVFVTRCVELPSTSEDRETYDVRVERKQALSDWLSEAAKAKISQEVDAANFQVLENLRF